MPTGIQWTDETWNVIHGCTKVSPACANCYIERTPPFRINHMKFERGHIPLRFFPDRLDLPLRWTRPRKIFVNSLSDLFHEDVPDAFIDKIFAIMALCPQHTFQILTKRQQRMLHYTLGLSKRLGDLWDLTNQPTWVTLPAGRSFPRYPENWPLPNVWMGVSVENTAALERVIALLHTPAAVRWISAEPLLERLDLRHVRYLDEDVECEWDVLDGSHEVLDSTSVDAVTDARDGNTHLDLVVVGGENLGPGGDKNLRTRPTELGWMQQIVLDCAATGVAAFVKQLGQRAMRRRIDTDVLERYRVSGAGGNMAEWPTSLRVRQFPTDPAFHVERSAGLN